MRARLKARWNAWEPEASWRETCVVSINETIICLVLIGIINALT